MCVVEKRLIYLIAIVVFSFFIADPGLAADDRSRPNVLLIVTDNQSASTIGSYGNASIRTPNIDRLAAEGMRFNQAFAVNGVCSPTRATMMTGLIPSQTGVHFALLKRVIDKGPKDWSAIAEFRSLPQTLKDAGYYTGLIGKYHLGSPYEPQLKFDEWVTFPSGHTTSFHGVTVLDNGETYVADGHITDFWTERAVEFINQQSKGKPFFLMLTYNGPYNLPPSVNEVPINRYAEYYASNPPPFPQEPVHPYLKNWAQQDSGDVAVGINAWNAIDALNNPIAMQNLSSEVSMVDDGVGKILTALEKSGLSENTLLIFTSDQGSGYGHHGLWGNTSWSRPTTAFDSHIRIPLIFRFPENIAENRVSEIMVSEYDLLPTILDIVGFRDMEIANSPGKSYASILHGNQVEWDDVIFFDHIHTRAIRTSKWKYIKRFLSGPDELYNLIQDPGERNNLIDNELYSRIKEALDAKLTSFFEEYADPNYDLWNGGTAKANLVPGDDSFANHFPNWQSPHQNMPTPFSDVQE